MRGLVWFIRETGRQSRRTSNQGSASTTTHPFNMLAHTKTNRDKCKDPECEEEKRLKRIKRLRMAMPGVIFPHPRGDRGRGP